MVKDVAFSDEVSMRVCVRASPVDVGVVMAVGGVRKRAGELFVRFVVLDDSDWRLWWQW